MAYKKFSKRILMSIGISVATVPADAAVLERVPLVSADAEHWPDQNWSRVTSPLSAQASSELDRFFSSAMVDEVGTTHAVLVVHRGQIVAERYGSGYRCDGIAHTMSIAKMMGAVMVGRLAQQGRMSLNDRVSFPQWNRTNDPRRSIQVRHLLQMSSGLQWKADGVLDSDLVNMAFGSGFRDLAGFVAAKPLQHRPGTYFQYSDGTPSLIGDLVRREVGGNRRAVAQFLREDIFQPIGMTRTEAEFDRHGTWYGPSGIRWSPCDLARFGLFLSRDGVWRGQRLLPEGWVDFMRTPSSASLNTPNDLDTVNSVYGAFSFVYDIDRRQRTGRIDSFGHLGFGGSVLRIVPSRDLVLVMYGSGGYSMETMATRLDGLRRIERLFPERRLATRPGTGQSKQLRKH
jgi:CubicO group peptidase (beta-lactamase class C family)